MNKPLTVSMTPSFYYEGDWLLKAQLKCLSEQINKDFDVCLIDAHYSKRKDLVPEYSKKYNLEIIHVPYKPNIHIAKRLDCAIFNAPYCYSESERIVRLSCWRFVRPDFTDICINSTCNVDFYFHSCEPNKNNLNTETDHDVSIWNFGSDEVNWHNIPKHGDPRASWTIESETDLPETLMPINCYGNYMIFRRDWIKINGCDEVFTNNEHWEDQDFCLRARNAGITCKRVSNKLYRLHHFYGSHSGRANVNPDWNFKTMCENCCNANLIPKPTRYNVNKRWENGEIEIFPKHCIWVCKTCHLSSPCFSTDESEYLKNIIDNGRITSNVISKYKIGRNLKVLVKDMDGKSLEEKIEIYNDSWINGKYYVE